MGLDPRPKWVSDPLGAEVSYFACHRQTKARRAGLALKVRATWVKPKWSSGAWGNLDGTGREKEEEKKTSPDRPPGLSQGIPPVLQAFSLGSLWTPKRGEGDLPYKSTHPRASFFRGCFWENRGSVPSVRDQTSSCLNWNILSRGSRIRPLGCLLWVFPLSPLFFG